MDGKNIVERLYREWVDDIEDWCRAGIQELSHSTTRQNHNVTRQLRRHQTQRALSPRSVMMIREEIGQSNI